MDIDGNLVDTFVHAPKTLCALWAASETLAPLTAPMPPQMVLALLFVAVLRIMADVVSWEAKDLKP